MRRDGPNTFKGSIFVEFATQEMADDFLKQELKIGETVLEKMTRYLSLTSIFPGVLILSKFYFIVKKRKYNLCNQMICFA